jgi:antitoxin ParD1/3/4
MSSGTSVALDEPFSDFIDRQIAQGHYKSPAEVVQAGLRLLEKQEAKLAALRAALIEGEESGLAESFDIEEFLAEMHAAHSSK